MNKTEFLEAVKHEADGIKKHAFKKEIALLDIEGLGPNQKQSCIYGQMTGHCFSKRARIIIRKIGPKLMFEYVPSYYTTFSNIKSEIEKADIDKIADKWDSGKRRANNFTALEGVYRIKRSQKQKLNSLPKRRN